MSESNQKSFFAAFLSDYGMIFVLLLLVILFSVLTIKQQHPSGGEAGRSVASRILQQSQPGEAPDVLVVTRATKEDRAFGDAAVASLRDAGANVVGMVSGSASDVKPVIEKVLIEGGKIDFIAANNATAKWGVYDRFPEVGGDKCVTPQPYLWPDFLKASNLLGVANQTAVYAIIAIGMTMVIITAGIDLSVGSLIALSSVACALVMTRGPQSVALAMAAGLLICAASGFFCGSMVTLFRIPPFIVSLALMMMASGLAFRLSDGRSIDGLPEAFFVLGQGTLLGIPNPAILMAILYAIAHVVMSRTIFGRYVYAIGGNEEAARLSGVPVRAVLLCVYTICGALAGLGGLVLTSRLAAGDPKFGLMYELDVIAAVVVGGTSLMGGKGRIFGTLIGAFIIAVIKTGMNLTGVGSFNQKIVLGGVLLLAVLLDTPMGKDQIPLRAQIVHFAGRLLSPAQRSSKT